MTPAAGPGVVRSSLFMSLDGVVSADEGWQFAYFDAELFASVTAAWDRAGAVVMGRRSFEGYRALRADHPDSPMLAFLDRVDRYVASTTLTDPQWPGTTVIADDLIATVSQVRDSTRGETLVAGSPSILRQLLSVGALDDLDITILPIVVGTGDRLFPDQADDGLDRLPLALADHRVLKSGAVQLTYRRADG